MGRLHHLRQTLPFNLSQNSEPQVEFVLLDYHSQDGLGAWIREHFSKEIASGHLVYYRTEAPRYYHSAHAKEERLANMPRGLQFGSDHNRIISNANLAAGRFRANSTPP